MKKKAFRWVIGMVATALSVGAVQGVWAEEPQKTEEELAAAATQIDQETMAGSDSSRVESLAKEFSVPASTVQRLRDQRQGWGEITTELALAQQLSKTDSQTYPTTSDGLSRVEQLRAEGNGWGQVAQKLDMKLGPVISEVHRAHHQFESQRVSKSDNPESVEKVKREKPEKISHPDRVDRPERPEKPEKISKNR